MFTHFPRLVSVLAFFLTSPCWAVDSQPLPHLERIEPIAVTAGEQQVTGELRFYRHIDPVTGQGAVSILADGKESPLDFRQFKLDILLRPGTYLVKGHWSKDKRLVVTEAHPAGPRKAMMP